MLEYFLYFLDFQNWLILQKQFSQSIRFHWSRRLRMHSSCGGSNFSASEEICVG